MLSVFLLQLAGGSMLSIGLCRIDDMSWRYLRLVAYVSLASLALAAILAVLTDGPDALLSVTRGGLIDTGFALAFVWFVLNARQRQQVRPTQRLVAGIAGIASLLAALPMIQVAGASPAALVQSGKLMSVSSVVLFGAMLIGSVTAAMLLGHRYLTDTGMTIAPLRRLTNLFIAAILLRALSVTVSLILRRDLLSSDNPSHQWILFLLAVRIGVGILGTAVFAYMVWDCVRRRSTQSATGILYLTMVFVFIGELTAQYLLRWKGLAV